MPFGAPVSRFVLPRTEARVVKARSIARQRALATSQGLDVYRYILGVK
jgi:hypothetical protein